ncbi:MAG: PIG-L family deacetylase, partial [Paraburkholderia sp.]|nr:PIG-L family deacetylase [Paraburkholderia sp.]
AACCEMLPRLSHLTWFGYEEGIQRRMPGVVDARLADLAQRGIVATQASSPVVTAHTIDPQRQAFLKREAVSAYVSHLQALGPQLCEDVFAPERYWQLSVARQSGRRVKK